MSSDTSKLTDKLSALSMVLAHQPDFQHDFGRWLLRRWDDFIIFCDEADAYWALSTPCSARDITRKWESDNNRSAGLARLYCLLRPERRGMFQLRYRR